MIKSGFVAVVGRPNVGKSSLVNALVGLKVAIVSPKPQTTRDKILGIYNDNECQVVFADTPGVHEPRSVLGDYMMKSVKSATIGCDLILIVASAEQGLMRQDIELIERYARLNVPMILVYNKMDLIAAQDALPELDKLNAEARKDLFCHIVPTSCKNGHNMDRLLGLIKSMMPMGERFYDDNDYTDKSERYLLAETVREKALLFLQKEIPHGIQVIVENMSDDGIIKRIDVCIIVEKESHKPIVIGKHGAMLKRIMTSSRLDIEKQFECKAALKAFVKVVENWRDKPGLVSDFGYKKED